MRWNFAFYLSIAVVFGTTAIVDAVIRNVPSQYPTIQAGINAAVNGDTVLVANGTYTGTGNKNIDFLGTAIVVKSAGGAENCIIDCQNSGRGFYFHSNELLTSTLDGFKIINGAVTNCGGGIKIENSSPTIKNCIIYGNHANGTGGNACGGGIAAQTNASPLISNCTISNNTCNWDGAGLALAQSLSGPPSSPIVECCIIEGNTSTVISGGMGISNTTTAIIRNTLIVNNIGPEVGAMHIWSASPLIMNCVIRGNTGNIYAGGINLGWGGGEPPSSPTIKNTIIKGNTGVGIRSQSTTNNPLVIYNDFHNNSGGNFSSMPAGLGVISTTNLNGDPCDQYYNIFLDPLFYSTTGDSAFYLTANSPCIDAGDPTSPLDPDGTIADIGAFYYCQNFPVIGDLIIIIQNNDVVLTWTPVTSAVSYNIYRSDTPYFDITGMIPISTTTNESFTDTNAVSAEGGWFYKVTYQY